MSLTQQLDLYQLRSFHALALAGSFTGAARRLNVTQSAVSHALAKLESSAGVQLVNRKSRAPRLTEEGRRLFRACEQVFSALDAVTEDLGQTQATGRLRLGATVEFGCSILIRHIQPFLAAHPGLEVDFTLSHDLLTPLLRDDLDLVIDCADHCLPELKKDPWFREAYVVAASAGFQKAHRIRQPADLAHVPVLSLDKAAAWWHRFLLALPGTRRPEFRQVIEVNHVRAMINAGVAGMGVLLAPTYSVLQELRRGELTVLLPRIRPAEDRFCIYQRKSRAGLAKHRLLTDYLQTISPAEFGA